MFILVLSLSWLEGTGSSLGLSFWPKSEILKKNWPTSGRFFCCRMGFLKKYYKKKNFFSLFALHADELKDQRTSKKFTQKELFPISAKLEKV